MRQASVKVTLNNGMSVTLSEAKGWQATISDRPTIVGGYPAQYYWTEQEVPGYVQTGATVVGNTTVITNSLPRRGGDMPEDTPNVPKRTRGDSYLIIEDYGTPLGVEVVINHVGDCFD